jgi:hypothetical protein
MGSCCRARVGCTAADRLRGILGFCGEWFDADHRCGSDDRL